MNNSDFFNRRPCTNMGPQPFKTKKPTKTTIAVLSAISTLFMIICLFFNRTALHSDDAIIILGTIVINFFSFIIISGTIGYIANFYLLISVIVSIAPFFVLGVIAISMPSVGVGMVLSACPLIVPIMTGNAIGYFMSVIAKRTNTIIMSTVAALIGVAVCVAPLCVAGMSLISARGFDRSFAGLVDFCKSVMCDALGMYLQMFSEIYKIDVGEFDIAGTVNAFFNVLPGMICSVCVVFVMAAQLITLALAKITSVYTSLESYSTEYRVNIVSAIVYAVCTLVTLLGTSGDSIVFAVMQNISIILCPVLTLSGIISLLPKKYGRMVRVGCFPITAVFFLVAVYPPAAVMLLSFMGVFYVIRTERGRS